MNKLKLFKNYSKWTIDHIKIGTVIEHESKQAIITDIDNNTDKKLFYLSNALVDNHHVLTVFKNLNQTYWIGVYV